MFNKHFVQEIYHIEAISDKRCSIVYFANEKDRNYILNIKENVNNSGLTLTFVEKAVKNNSQSPSTVTGKNRVNNNQNTSLRSNTSPPTYATNSNFALNSIASNSISSNQNTPILNLISQNQFNV